MQSNLQEKDFGDRLKISDALTFLIVNYLVKVGHICAFRKATYEEDKDGAIDYWVDMNKACLEPVQVKLRIKPGNNDIPVVRYQPFWGIDNPETIVGRDYRGIVEGQTTQYYVAAVQGDGSIEVYRTSKAKLKPILAEIDQAWEQHDPARPWLYCKRRCNSQKNSFLLRTECDERGKGLKMIFGPGEDIQSGWQIWWQKNPNERFAKINFYLPSDLKEESWVIPAALYQKMIRAAEKFSQKPALTESLV